MTMYVGVKVELHTFLPYGTRRR